MPTQDLRAPTENGVVLFATCASHYLLHAYLSAVSARRFLPETSITLFTDRTDHPLVGLPVFDRVENVEIRQEFKNDWATGKFLRIDALRRSVYEKTLHVDCDTRFRSAEAAAIFDILDDSEIGLVENAPDASYTRRKYGRRLFNGGVIAYRKTEGVCRFFDHWQRLNRMHHEASASPTLPDLDYLEHVPEESVKRRLLLMDQLGMAQLLSPEVNVYDLDVVILDRRWNDRRFLRERQDHEPPPIIDHAPDLDHRLYADTLQELVRLMREGDRDSARIIFETMLEVAGDRHPDLLPKLEELGARVVESSPAT